jgi:hypothetical protein
MGNKIQIIGREKNSESFINILPASDFIPTWYRKTNPQMTGTTTELNFNNPQMTNSTYKKCSPFFDGISSGYMVYLSADIEVTRKDDGMPYIMWRTKRTIISDHDFSQWDGLPVPKGYSAFVYKWHNQFGLKTPKGYSLLFMSPANRFDLPFQTITGIVDTDKYTAPIHFPFFIRDDFSGIIESGTPIVQIVPIKRDIWSRDFIEYNEKDTDILSETFLSKIKRSYKNNFWTRKEYK